MPTLTYPGPAMQSLIDGIRADIHLLRRWFDAPREGDPTGTITAVTPVTVLATLEKVTESVEPALRFFLNYPTQRLSVFLIGFIEESQTFVSWLSADDSVSADPSLTAAMYRQSCERLHDSLRDWRNSIVIAGALHELDADTPEMQH